MRTTYRFRGQTPPSSGIRASILTSDAADGVATLRLYDPVDSWGGDWGVSAKEFAQALDALPDDTAEIQLHINSPGGEVFEGVAILNLLRQHKARQTRNKRIGQFVRWLCHGLFVRPLHSLQKGLRHGSDIAVECLPEVVKEPAVAQVRRLARETEFNTAHTAFEQQAAQPTGEPLPASTEAQASPSAKTTRSAA